MPGTLTALTTREQFQATIDIAADGDVIELNAFEFQGPIHLGKPITLRGTGATIWARGGPVLTVSSKGVRLQNLRLELTGDDQIDHPLEGCALEITNDVNVILDNVTVRGRVTGLVSEEGAWMYPLSLSLGRLAPGKDHTCRINLFVPVPCDLISEIYGVEATPHRLAPGKNEVLLKVDPHLPRDMFMSGYITLITPYVKRQISICAHILREAPPGADASDSVAYSPDGWDKLGTVPTVKPEPQMEVNKISTQPVVHPPPIYPEATQATATGPGIQPRISDRRRISDASVPISTLFSQPVAPIVTELAEPVLTPSSTQAPAENHRIVGKPTSSIFSQPPSNNVAVALPHQLGAEVTASPPSIRDTKVVPTSKMEKKSSPVSLPSALFSTPAKPEEKSAPSESVVDKNEKITGGPRRIQSAKPSSLFTGE